MNTIRPIDDIELCVHICRHRWVGTAKIDYETKQIGSILRQYIMSSVTYTRKGSITAGCFGFQPNPTDVEVIHYLYLTPLYCISFIWGPNLWFADVAYNFKVQDGIYLQFRIHQVTCAAYCHLAIQLGLCTMSTLNITDRIQLSKAWRTEFCLLIERVRSTG